MLAIFIPMEAGGIFFPRPATYSRDGLSFSNPSTVTVHAIHFQIAEAILLSSCSSRDLTVAVAVLTKTVQAPR